MMYTCLYVQYTANWSNVKQNIMSHKRYDIVVSAKLRADTNWYLTYCWELVNRFTRLAPTCLHERHTLKTCVYRLPGRINYYIGYYIVVPAGFLELSQLLNFFNMTVMIHICMSVSLSPQFRIYIISCLYSRSVCNLNTWILL